MHPEANPNNNTHFDTTREFMPGTRVPAESARSMITRITGREFQPAGRGYVGAHHQ